MPNSLSRARKEGRQFQNPVETTVGGFGMLPKVLSQYLTNKEERVPHQPLGPFHTDEWIYRLPPATGLRITWMGHSSMLIEIDDVRILVDPVWDQRASPVAFMGPKRFFHPPLPLDKLPTLDAVVISHDHYDHLGKHTIRKLATLPALLKTEWITSLGVGKRLREFGVQPGRIAELDWTQQATVIGQQSGAELAITALPARHFSGRTPWDRFQTLWSSFVLRGKQHNIYFGADSGWWDGFEEIGKQYGPFHLTMLEIGAYNDLWKSIHMGPDGAIQAFQALGNQGLFMPIHWGLFDLALHSWRQPIQRTTELAAVNGIKLWSPTPGVPTEVLSGQPLQSEWWKPQNL